MIKPGDIVRSSANQYYLVTAIPPGHVYGLKEPIGVFICVPGTTPSRDRYIFDLHDYPVVHPDQVPDEVYQQLALWRMDGSPIASRA